MSMRFLAGFISAFYNPLQVPNAPTIGTATKGDTLASVTFTAPTNVGGGAITSYIATARKTSDGASVSASGASSPITITGLTNGSAYTITVAAINSFGPSASSANSNSVTPSPLAIGDPYQGGFFAGQISTAGNGIANFNLVIGPVASAQANRAWKTSNTSGDPTSVIDGPGNTATMNSATYPAAQFCSDLVTGGFSDWYMPALNELDIVYFGLKPSTTNNTTTVGINANSVPKRTSNYTTGNPAQTSAAAFQSGGAEAFSPAASYWWSSTQKVTFPGNIAGYVTFFDAGALAGGYKTQVFPVRAVRRVAV